MLEIQVDGLDPATRVRLERHRAAYGPQLERTRARVREIKQDVEAAIRQYVEPLRRQQHEESRRQYELETELREQAAQALSRHLQPGGLVVWNKDLYREDLFIVDKAEWLVDGEVLTLQVRMTAIAVRGGRAGHGKFVSAPGNPIRRFWSPFQSVAGDDVAQLSPAPADHPRLKAYRRRAVKLRLKGERP